jgi:hypothetical protein
VADKILLLLPNTKLWTKFRESSPKLAEEFEYEDIALRLSDALNELRLDNSN